MTLDFILRMGNALIYLVLTIKLYQRYKESKEVLIKWFATFCFFMCLFQLSIGLPAYICIWLKRYTVLEKVIKYGFTVGHALLAIGGAFLALIPAHFLWPRFKKLHFATIIALGLIATVGNILGAEGKYIQDTVIAIFPRINNILMPIFSFLGIGLAGIFLLIYAFKQDLDKKLRIRSVVMGGGITFANSLGPLHQIITTPIYWTLLDVGTLLGFTITAFAVFFIKPEERTIPRKFYK